jgi:charged multivesicular body protein 3
LTKWKSTIRREERLLDRQIASLKEQEDKSRKMVQQMAKKRPQDVGSARILAKELVRAKKQRQRMYQSKATLNSIQMQLQEQIGTTLLQVDLIEATYKISGILKQSTGVMRDVNSLVKIPELNRDMRQFSMELTKVLSHKVKLM